MGLQRQAEEFLPFCEKHGLTPNPDPIRDEGLSAFHCKHLKHGNLAGFLEAAEAGLVPESSVLVVEDWSRFSRRKVSDSQQMLHRLWDRGLALGWVREDIVITREVFDARQDLRIKLDLTQQSAHDFSAGLSKTVTQVWALREKAFVETGQKYLSMSAAPDWVEVKDGDFVENDRAEWMRDVFRLRLQGLGASQIARNFNARGRGLSGGGSFSEGRIGRILRDRRLLGEKEWKSGRISPNYYPRVIDIQLWDQVQRLVDKARTNPGRTGKGNPIRNILQGITFCKCGAPLSWQGTHKNKETGKFRYAYLRCTAKRHRCPEESKDWKYDEELLLQAFMNERWDKFFKTPIENKEIRRLRAQAREQEATCIALEETAANSQRNLEALLGSPEFDAEAIQLLTGIIKGHQKTAAAARKELSSLQADLQVLELQPSGAAVRKQIQERTEAFLSNLDDFDERRRFNNWVNTLGIQLTITDGARGVMEWGRTQARLYREGDSLVMDQVEADAAALGLDLDAVRAMTAPHKRGQ